jgi:hypothetical protein
MKRLLATAAIALSLTTSAQAQLLLPPPPPTALETDHYNLAVIAMYAANCKRGDPEYKLGQPGKPGGRIGTMITLMINERHGIDRGITAVRRSIDNLRSLRTRWTYPGFDP